MSEKTMRSNGAKRKTEGKKTSTKRRMLAFIRRFRAEHDGISPTYQQIAVGIGWKAVSKGTVQTYVQEMVEEGLIRRGGPREARSLIPVDNPK